MFTKNQNMNIFFYINFFDHSEAIKMQKKVSKKKLRFLLLPDRFCNFHFFLTFFQKSTSIRPKKWRKKWKIRKSKYISLIFYKINIYIISSFIIKFWSYSFLFSSFFPSFPFFYTPILGIYYLLIKYVKKVWLTSTSREKMPTLFWFYSLLRFWQSFIKISFLKIWLCMSAMSKKYILTSFKKTHKNQTFIIQTYISLWFMGLIIF
jgi:hypothetical protein